MAGRTIDGTTLEVVEQGSGDPVLLVHGSASDHRTWEGPAARLSDRFRVIRYSRRYHWPNPPIGEGEDYSMGQHVEDLRALIEDLDAGPVHLVGHSYGGFVSLLLAISAPELVRSLTLAEPPVVTLFVSNDPRPAELLRVLLTRPRTGLAILRFGARGIGPARKAARSGDLDAAIHHFGTTVLGRRAYEALGDERREMVRVNTCAAEFVGSGFPALSDDEVRGVRIPVLLVGSEHSAPLFARLLDRLEELLPRSERVRIRGTSHIVHEDDPAAFVAAVDDFLTRAV